MSLGFQNTTITNTPTHVPNYTHSTPCPQLHHHHELPVYAQEWPGEGGGLEAGGGAIQKINLYGWVNYFFFNRFLVDVRGFLFVFNR